MRTRTCSGRRGPLVVNVGAESGGLPSACSPSDVTRAAGTAACVPVCLTTWLDLRPKLGSTTKPSAMADANPTRGSSRLSSKQRKRGAQSGWYFTFERYSASSCHQREKKTSTERQMRRIGPAPMREPSSNTERNTAKLSETRTTPISSERVANSETINSTTPLGAVGLRRIRSSETPFGPHGTSESMPTTLSSSVPSPMTASTRRQSPSR